MCHVDVLQCHDTVAIISAAGKPDPWAWAALDAWARDSSSGTPDSGRRSRGVIHPADRQAFASYHGKSRSPSRKKPSGLSRVGLVTPTEVNVTDLNDSSTYSILPRWDPLSAESERQWAHRSSSARPLANSPSELVAAFGARPTRTSTRRRDVEAGCGSAAVFRAARWVYIDAKGSAASAGSASSFGSELRFGSFLSLTRSERMI